MLASEAGIGKVFGGGAAAYGDCDVRLASAADQLGVGGAHGVGDVARKRRPANQIANRAPGLLQGDRTVVPRAEASGDLGAKTALIE